VERGGDAAGRDSRLSTVRNLTYNDLAADRQTVAAVQALEAILEHQRDGRPDVVARVNDPRGGLVLDVPGSAESRILYRPAV
jgi:hypothetical protein